MSIKIIGAVFVIAGCAWFGFSLCSNHRLEEKSLHQLMGALDYMGCELQYHMTPLPDLCRQTGDCCKGVLQQFFRTLGKELEGQAAPDAVTCMKAVIEDNGQLPEITKEILLEFGTSLGCFDLPGQLSGLEAARQSCRRALNLLTDHRDVRLRSYQTLGICAGAALVVLFI